MERSPEIDKLVAALSKIQAVGLVAVKKAENKQLNKRYADLIEVWEIIRPHLEPNGLTLSQWPGLVRSVEAGVMAASLTNMLAHTSGQFICQTMEVPIPEPIIGKQSGQSAVNIAQRMGSAISYARRYGALCILGIPSGDDDDAQRAFHQQSSQNAVEATGNETWQELLKSGGWRQAPAPEGEGWQTLGELKWPDLKPLIKANAANGYNNQDLIACSAFFLSEACDLRGHTVMTALEAVGWTGPDTLTQMSPDDIMQAYNAILPLPVKKEVK